MWKRFVLFALVVISANIYRKNFLELWRYWFLNTFLDVILILKGELGEIHIYFRKVFLHQQKFLVVSVLSYSP